MLKRFLWLLIFLSLIPASILLVQRIQVEGSKRHVTFVMDEQALASQAEFYGLTSFELGKRYQALGLNGIVLDEETLISFANKGDLQLLSEASLRARAIQEGQPLPDLPTDSLLITGLTNNVLENFMNKTVLESETVRLFERDWLLFKGSNVSIPAGPNRAELKQWSEAGFDIAYRPRSYPNMANVGADYPPEASYLVYAGLQIAGHPHAIDDVIAASQPYITGIIEGTDQEGLEDVSSEVPTARLLSFNQDYINIRLSPEDLVRKYLLSADERGVQIMYLRPYITTQQGDMIENTEQLIKLLKANFEAEGYIIGPLPILERQYQPSNWLRASSSVGVIASLGLLALLYPGAWGIMVTLAVIAVGILFGRFDWDAIALMAALSFPVLGYGYLSGNKIWNVGLATLLSIIGAILLSAVGTDYESMLAIKPFAGVGAVLLLPPALFIFHYALKFRRPAAWVRDFWETPIQLGHILLFLIACAALAVIALRRGNVSILGVSETEIAIRDWLNDLFVRPRFKELIGHPLAVLGLMEKDWSEWIRALLLTGGVIAQATIINSFSHYHTPFLISLERTIIALVLGLILGFIMLPIIRFGIRIVKTWLSKDTQPNLNA